MATPINIEPVRRERARIAKLRDDASPCRDVTNPNPTCDGDSAATTCHNCKTYGAYAAMVKSLDDIIREHRA